MVAVSGSEGDLRGSDGARARASQRVGSGPGVASVTPKGHESGCVMSETLSKKRLVVLFSSVIMCIAMFAGAPVAQAAVVHSGGFPNTAAGKSSCEAWKATKVASLSVQGYTIESAVCFKDQGWWGRVVYS